MAKILFASNNIAHFPGSVSTSLAGSFDATRVPYGISLDPGQVVTAPDFAPSTTTVTSFHFNSFANEHPSTDTLLFACFDSLNRRIVHMTKTWNTGATQNFTLNLFNGTSTLTVNSSFNMTEDRINTFDIVVTVNLSQIKVDVYVNNGLCGTLNFGANINGITNPIRFQLGGAFAENPSKHIFSEILVADADTRNARLNLLRPATTGGYDDWSGSVANLADDDNSTGVFTTLANQRQTVGLTAYTGAEHIANLVSISQTVRGVNSPTKLKHTIRFGGLDYDSADIPIAFTPQYNIVDLPINPGTSLAWTRDDLSGLEVGFLSVA